MHSLRLLHLAVGWTHVFLYFALILQGPNPADIYMCFFTHVQCPVEFDQMSRVTKITHGYTCWQERGCSWLTLLPSKPPPTRPSLPLGYWADVWVQTEQLCQRAQVINFPSPGFLEGTRSPNLFSLRGSSGTNLTTLAQLPPYLEDPHTVPVVSGNSGPMCYIAEGEGRRGCPEPSSHASGIGKNSDSAEKLEDFCKIPGVSGKHKR